jgi:CBS domain-containing protein
MKKVQIHEPYLVADNQTIYDCLLKFEQNNVHTLLVTHNNKIVGSVTDGDIRKALIKSRLLHSVVNSVMNIEYVFALSESECQDLFDQYEYILLIPVLNQWRELTSIYLRY